MAVQGSTGTRSETRSRETLATLAAVVYAHLASFMYLAMRAVRTSDEGTPGSSFFPRPPLDTGIAAKA